MTTTLMQVISDHLDSIKQEIQDSEELKAYLESEETEDYKALSERFEPSLLAAYTEVATLFPTQVIPLEEKLLEEGFEGLLLPKILGYAVLRGDIDAHYRYLRPQEHFKKILLAISNSSNFDVIRLRIGQSIQIGFALSSDIWITNLINMVENKKVRLFLKAQKLEKYRDVPQRQAGYQILNRQFIHDIYFTTEFPKDQAELRILYPSVLNFLKNRIIRALNNENILEPVAAMLCNDSLTGCKEYDQLLVLCIHFFDFDEQTRQVVGSRLNQLRKKEDDFQDLFLEFLNSLQASGLPIGTHEERRVLHLLDAKTKDDLYAYYHLMEEINTRGYVHPDIFKMVQEFHGKNEGLSLVNECLRHKISLSICNSIRHLDEESYLEFYEITKVFPVYMDIFSNEKFNQDLKHASLDYLKRLLVRYTDKRGKDYQDIKKFVSASFVDFGFLREKDVVEMFKTKRKKKEA